MGFLGRMGGMGMVRFFHLAPPSFSDQKAGCPAGAFPSVWRADPRQTGWKKEGLVVRRDPGLARGPRTLGYQQVVPSGTWGGTRAVHGAKQVRTARPWIFSQLPLEFVLKL